MSQALRYLSIRPVSLFSGFIWPASLGRDDRKETRQDIQVDSIKVSPLAEAVGVAVNRCFGLELNKSLCSLSWASDDSPTTHSVRQVLHSKSCCSFSALRVDKPQAISQAPVWQLREPDVAEVLARLGFKRASIKDKFMATNGNHQDHAAALTNGTRRLIALQLSNSSRSRLFWAGVGLAPTVFETKAAVTPRLMAASFVWVLRQYATWWPTSFPSQAFTHL